MTENELRAAAQAAAEAAESKATGCWWVESGQTGRNLVMGGDDDEHGLGCVQADCVSSEIAAYIAAANPTAVLALLEKLERCRKALRSAADALDKTDPACGRLVRAWLEGI